MKKDNLEMRLLSLAVDNGLLGTEVMMQYESILDYVIKTYPPHNIPVYQEIAYIRTRNWSRSLANERRFHELNKLNE